MFTGIDIMISRHQLMQSNYSEEKRGEVKEHTEREREGEIDREGEREREEGSQREFYYIIISIVIINIIILHISCSPVPPVISI